MTSKDRKTFEISSQKGNWETSNWFSKHQISIKILFIIKPAAYTLLASPNISAKKASFLPFAYSLKYNFKVQIILRHLAADYMKIFIPG